MEGGYKILRNLQPQVVELVMRKGWESFTEIQELAFPEILKGKNTLLIAPTGYGKTEAALIPVLDMVLREKVKPVAILYITPLRALINDLVLRIRWWTRHLGLHVARKHGDVPQSEKARRLRTVPHIMVLTPEGLEIDLDWASRFRGNYRNVRWVIVDEVHELASSKRGIQLAVLLERLKKFIGYDSSV